MEEQKTQYLSTLSAKERIAYEVSKDQLQIRLEDTIGFQKWFQKWYQSNIKDGNQRNGVERCV